MHVLASFRMRSSDIAAMATLVNRSAGGRGHEMSLLSSDAIGIAASMKGVVLLKRPGGPWTGTGQISRGAAQASLPGDHRTASRRLPV